MYRYAYEEFVTESGAEARDREAAAFDRAIGLLEQAEAEGPGGEAAREALRFSEELWLILIEDLSHPENRLEEALRASLISIGIWVLRECERIRQGESTGFRNMADINALIRDGLK